ncbi:MAG TPA: membrane protein insertion efficiency factor YidD [Tepidisphaeraceae bacterium]|nr:membrane protein insertion efficiency factor YidD [Tepidisphaeraceae bacterium]
MSTSTDTSWLYLPAEFTLAGILIWAILMYQRYVSPRKGYGCAYRIARRRCSCSEHGRRLLRRVGAVRFVPGMLRRFRKCATAARALRGRAIGRVAPGLGLAVASGPRVIDYRGPGTPMPGPATEDRPAGGSESTWKRDCAGKTVEAMADGGCECLGELFCSAA